MKAINNNQKNMRAGAPVPIKIDLPDFFPEHPASESSRVKIHVQLAEGWELIGEYTAGSLRTVRINHAKTGGLENG